MTRRRLAAFQLGILTAIHFTVDALTGTIAGFLPVLMKEFTLSVGMASWLITACAISGNAVQLFSGAVRRKATRPLLVPIGFALSCLLLGVGLVPVSGAAFGILLTMVTLVGVGIAFVHPEALRAVCAIDRNSISPVTATSFFMLAGFLGYACGPLFGGALVEGFGFRGLWLLLIPILPMFYLFFKARIHLAPDDGKRRSVVLNLGFDLRFMDIFVISVFINTGCSVMQGLLPTYLNRAGFSLSFGGFSAMIFGLGAGIGALLTGSVLLKRFAVAHCLAVQWCCGIPLLLLYLMLAGTFRWAVILVFAAGFLTGSGYPQLVALVQSVPGKLGLGARMGVIVGGTWGLAGLGFQLIAFFADATGVYTALFAAPFCFLLALAYLVIAYLHRR